jgi:hypothetical protein
LTYDWLFSNLFLKMYSLSSGTETLTPSYLLYLKDLGTDVASPIKVPTVS